MMTKNNDELSFAIKPARASLTMRGVVALEAEVGPGDMSAVMDILGRGDTEDTGLTATLFGDDDGGPSELVMGDADGLKGTFLTVEFEAPPEYAWCGFKLVVGQERLARIWSEARARIEAQEQTAGSREMVSLVKAVLQFASEQGGSPVDAFNEWLAASDRNGRICIPALPLAA